MKSEIGEECGKNLVKIWYMTPNAILEMTSVKERDNSMGGGVTIF
jgi:hypothetical protein